MIGYEANNLISIFLDNSSSTTSLSFLSIILFSSSSVVFTQLQSAMNLIWLDEEDNPEKKSSEFYLGVQFHPELMIHEKKLERFLKN